MAKSFIDSKVLLGSKTFDRWIIGEGTEDGSEYIVHLAEPVLVAKFTDDEENEDYDISGLTVAIGYLFFYDIMFLGEHPYSDAEIKSLFEEAGKAIMEHTEKLLGEPPEGYFE